MPEQTFAERLLAHRSLLELSQEQVGNLLGVSPQTISNWEAGTVPRKARIAQVETWITSGKAPKAEPVALGSGTPLYQVPVSQEVQDLRNAAETLRKKQLEDTKLQRRIERKAARDAEVAVFVQDLTEPLRQYASPPVTPYKHIKFHRDYLSSKISANLVFHVSATDTYDLATLDIVALKKLDSNNNEKRLFYVLIVVGADPSAQAKEITLTAIADLLGVGIHFVPDANAAAAVIVQLEDIAELL